MSQVNNVTSSSSSNNTTGSSKSLQNLGIDQFLKLMIAELQNQDPMNPMENSEMVRQLGEMRSITATDSLTSTLDAVLLGQNLTTASGLIGKEVTALTDAGDSVNGQVDRVTVAAEEGKAATVKVHIGSTTVSLNNIREILSAGE
jgi:flagellar basal-body rod modification protein FlgD